jgi:dimethylamine/trimethylamine dehydrogenase
MIPPEHQILFEPIKIGPVVSKNRFYQVPHCSGMGWQRPHSLAAMRGIKAEGGWGVVCTEYCSVHPTSDDGAYPYAALWDDSDIRANALMTDAVHAHGALAGVELWLGGGVSSNLGTRLPPYGLQDRPASNLYNPIQPRRIDKEDIRDIRKWHSDAAKRAVVAGFDIVYVYATHGYLLSEFLSSDTNERTDEYGGSLKNRVRIVQELIEETREAVRGKAAVATRFSVDINNSETYDAFSLLGESPDLWDLTVADYAVEMGHSRFIKEGALLGSIAKAKKITSKPVVAVGRFTSPDRMAEVLRSGSQDLIGAARPSIADPFLPNKIKEGRSEDIRECIGCNICYAYDSLGVPIRCTQNPTMGEEWRMGWHPEKISLVKKRKKILIIGSGPAGLEAARVFGEQGNEVSLAEKEREPGGRVTRESKLPGLSEWSRVRDWRIGQIRKLSNVDIFLESDMSAEDIKGFPSDLVVIATGSKWAIDGVGRHNNSLLQLDKSVNVFSPDDFFNGVPVPKGRILIFDDDHYYMGPVLALALQNKGFEVTLVTPAGRIGAWGEFTEEMFSSTSLLIAAGVQLFTNIILEGYSDQHANLKCVFSGAKSKIKTNTIIPLTRRIPTRALFDELKSDGFSELIRIGDCEAPGTIAAAVYSGYSNAICQNTTLNRTVSYAKRERSLL